MICLSFRILWSSRLVRDDLDFLPNQRIPQLPALPDSNPGALSRHTNCQ
jgi:hypothetical protein